MLSSESTSFRRDPTEACTVSTLSSAFFMFRLAVFRLFASAALPAEPSDGLRRVWIRFVIVVNTDCFWLGCTLNESPLAGAPLMSNETPSKEIAAPGV